MEGSVKVIKTGSVIKKEDNKLQVVHVTHIDSDAVGCAVLVNLMYARENAYVKTYYCGNSSIDKFVQKLIGEYMNNEIPFIPDVFIISDIGINADTYKKIYEAKERVLKNTIFIGLDHHKTNKPEEIYPGAEEWFDVQIEDNFLLDKSTMKVGRFPLLAKEGDDPSRIYTAPVSATLLIYKFFNNIYKVSLDSDNPLLKFKKMDDLKKVLKSPNVYKFVSDISRYDTWDWINNPTDHHEIEIADICKTLEIEDTVRRFTKNFCWLLFSNDEKTKDTWANDAYIPIDCKGIKKIVASEKKDEAKHIQSLVKKVNAWGKDTLLYIPSNGKYANEIMYVMNEYIVDDLGVDFITSFYPAQKVVSLRSKGDFDVAEFIKGIYPNGGGHKNASGATLPDDHALNLLQLFYEADRLTDLTIKEEWLF